MTLLDLFVSATRKNEDNLKPVLGVGLRQEIRCNTCGNIFEPRDLEC